ncbi:hypothetical protein QWA68_000398 [Fusarium oxysporum]|nr:hypothetical protein QWA68_000398 [Fusarium oxysporum]
MSHSCCQDDAQKLRVFRGKGNSQSFTSHSAELYMEDLGPHGSRDLQLPADSRRPESPWGTNGVFQRI